MHLTDRIIKYNSFPIYCLDRDLRFSAFNEAFMDMYRERAGADPEIGAVINSVMRTDPLSVKYVEYYMRTLNGETLSFDRMFGDICYEKRLSPMYDDAGTSIIGVSVFMYDVTENRKLEKEIISAKNRYEDIVNSVNDIIFQTDHKGLWTFLNHAWEAKMGYSLADCIGRPFFNYLHPDDVKRNEALFIPLINRHKQYCSHQIRYMTVDGSVKWMKVYAVLTLDENDQITGTSGTLTDITAEVENYEKYRMLAENINDSVCLHAVDGTFVFVSPSIEYLSGHKPEDMIGKNPYDFIHPDDKDKVSKIHGSLLDGNDNYLTIYRFRSSRGGYNWFETNNKLIRDESGTIINIITSSRVIDERMRAEENALKALEERRRLNDQRSRFISMASHEFRTPITSIQMSTDIIDLHLRELDLPCGDDVTRHIGIINKEIERFQGIMNDILILGKTESDAIELNKSMVCLVTLINRSIERIRETSAEERVIVPKFQGHERLVFIDGSQIQHIIENLISNAYKFSKGKPKPELYVTFRSDSFVIHIRDYGIGIPESDQSRLFSSFYRASNTTNIQGTGLGLVLIKNLVHLHHGTIEIISRENQGTEVIVMIKG